MDWQSILGSTKMTPKAHRRFSNQTENYPQITNCNGGQSKQCYLGPRYQNASILTALADGQAHNSNQTAEVSFCSFHAGDLSRCAKWLQQLLIISSNSSPDDLRFSTKHRGTSHVHVLESAQVNFDEQSSSEAVRQLQTDLQNRRREVHNAIDCTCASIDKSHGMIEYVERDVIGASSRRTGIVLSPCGGLEEWAIVRWKDGSESRWILLLRAILIHVHSWLRSNEVIRISY